MDEQLTSWLERPELAFAVGAPGAIAEFRQVPGDPPPRREAMSLCSPRGAIRITPKVAAQLTMDATPRRHQHGHGDADEGAFLTHRVSLPLALATLGARTGITALGEDAGAIAQAHRGHHLFDMGLGLPHLEACVRSDDARLTAVLTECEGADILDPDCPAMGAIKSASPHRVFMSALARIEIFQGIPSRARGERSPQGPHTHLLPRLLARTRTDTDWPIVLEVFEPSP